MKCVERCRALRGVLWTVAACALGSGFGCEGIAPRTDSKGFVDNVELEGFPVPERFEFQRGYQFAPQELAGRFRPTHTLFYRGPGLPHDHVPFFLREMQKRGWTLREILDDERSGSKTLDFVKGEEGTTVELSRRYEGALYGSPGCGLKATVRTLGLEAFTIDENLAVIDQRGDGFAGARPAGWAVDLQGARSGAEDGVERDGGDGLEGDELEGDDLEGVPPRADPGLSGSVQEGVPPAAGDPPSAVVPIERGSGTPRAVPAAGKLRYEAPDPHRYE